MEGDEFNRARAASPRWNEHGLLPPGDHPLELSELSGSILVRGDGTSAAWQPHWRAMLVANLARLVGQLASVGVRVVYVDGSFCSNKDRPGDIDGYFVTDFPAWLAEQQRCLVEMDEAWDLRRRDPASGKPLMWARYRVELYPTFHPPFDDRSSRGMHEGELIDSFFRRGRDGIARGLVRIELPGAQP